MFNKSEIFHKIEELASLHTGSSKRFDLNLVTQDLARFLHENRYAIDVDRLASSYVDSFDRGKRVTPHRGQLNLFEPDAWIPLGKKRRILMKFAEREHILSWKGIGDIEHEASANAHARTNAYINSRLSVWNSDEFKTLGELEAAKFSAIPETKEAAR